MAELIRESVPGHNQVDSRYLMKEEEENYFRVNDSEICQFIF